MGFFAKLFGKKSDERQEAADAAEHYFVLRQQVFDLPQNEEFMRVRRDNYPYALMMETGFEGGSFCLVAVQGGDASLYHSQGGGVIGAGRNEQVASMTEELLIAAEGFKDFLDDTEDFPLADIGHTRFFLITADGVRSGDYREIDLGEGALPMTPLFQQAHGLISTILAESKGNS